MLRLFGSLMGGDWTAIDASAFAGVTPHANELLASLSSVFSSLNVAQDGAAGAGAAAAGGDAAQARVGSGSRSHQQWRTFQIIMHSLRLLYIRVYFSCRVSAEILYTTFARAF